MKRDIYAETNQAYLYCYNKYLIEELLKLGLMRGDKIKNNIGVPYWIKENEIYTKKCIKGLIDTDGCIYICRRERQRYVKFTNCDQRLFHDFKELTKNLGYGFVSSNKRNVCLYRKEQVIRFINDIQPVKAKGS